MIEFPAFCEQWPSQSQLTIPQQEQYVLSELARIDRAGLPVLLTVLQQSDLDLQQTALKLLRSGGGDYDDGRPLPRRRHSWKLVLVQGAEPPHKDPQGRVLPDHLRGKVLSAKTGNLGGDTHGPTDVTVAGQHAGPVREQKARTGRPLYQLRQVGRTPEEFTLDEAMAILRQWGVGVSARQYDRPPAWGRGDGFDPSDPRGRGQCRWLVTEVPFPATDPDAADDGFGGRRSAATVEAQDAAAPTPTAPTTRRNRNADPPPPEG